MNSNKLGIFAVVCLAVVLLAVPGNASPSTAGTTGSISAGVSSAVDGAPIAIRLIDLTEGADYALVINGVTFSNWTCGSAETTKQFYTNVAEMSTNGYMKIQLTGGAADAIDTVYITITEYDTFFPEDMLIDLVLALVVILVIVGVVIGLKKGILH